MFVDLDWQRMPIGEDASCMIRPLSVVAYQKVAAYMQEVGVNMQDGEAVEAVFSNFDAEKMMSLCAQVLPSNAKDLSGVQYKMDGEVHDATIEDLVKYDAFLLACVQILGQIFSISTVSGIKQEGEKEGLSPEEEKKQENGDLLKLSPGD